MHKFSIIHCAKLYQSLINKWIWFFFTSIGFFLLITCTGVVVDLISTEPHLWVLSFSFYDAQLLLRCVCPSGACFCLELSREKRLMVLLLMVSHLLWKQFNAWKSKALLKYWDKNCVNEQLHKMSDTTNLLKLLILKWNLSSSWLSHTGAIIRSFFVSCDNK